MTEHTGIQVLRLTPVAKPRMTRGDRITLAKMRGRRRLNERELRKAPLLSNWMTYVDHLRLLRPAVDLDRFYHLVFVVPMARSWTLERKREMEYKPHQQIPDKDNLEKSFLDALFEEDKTAWDGRTTKLWGWTGAILISTENVELTREEYRELLGSK